MQYWDKTIRIIYSDLIERLKADTGLPSSGTISTVHPKGIPYFQHRVSYEGERLTFSTSSDPNDVDFSERAKLCSVLTVSGCNAPDRTAIKTIELLDAMGCFAKQQCVLIGSHAFSAIGNSLGVSWDAGTSETRDVDLSRMVKLSGAPFIQITPTLLKAGFREILQLNRKHPPTNFVHKKNGMKIDFLTPMIGKPDHAPARLHGTDIHAEPIRFLDYLIREPQQAAVITRNGVLVNVPQPARYALHKCIIYQYRRDTDKKEKDLLQAQSILTVLEERMPHLIVEAWNDLQWQEKAMTGISELNDIELTERLTDLLT